MMNDSKQIFLVPQVPEYNGLPTVVKTAEGSRDGFHQRQTFKAAGMLAGQGVSNDIPLTPET
jgi:hypothetical protein